MSRSSRTGRAVRAAGTRAYKPGPERRAEIMAATIAILTERGLSEWKTAELARRVGISEAALFRHFRNKEEILEAAVRQETRAVRRLLRDQPETGAPWDRAEALVRTVLQFFERTGGGPLVVFTGQAIRFSPALKGDVLRTIAMVRASLEQHYREALRGREDSILRPEALADLSIAVIQSCALRWIVSEHQFPLHQASAGMLAVLRRAGAPSRGRTT